MNTGRIRRIGAFIGASGCSIALLYGTYSVVYKNPVGHRGSNEESTALVVGQDAGNIHPKREDLEAHPIVRKDTKSMRQRMKDAVERRRTQQRFPWNGWWHLRKYRSSGRAGQDEDKRRVSYGTSETLIHYPTGKQVAARYPDVINDIRILAQNLLGPNNKLLSRFDDVELARYAVHYGILRIKDDYMRDKARQMVVQDAAEGVVDSQQWFQTHTFASIQEIHSREFANLIRWEYNPDTDERPILHVDVGKAVNVCRNKAMQLEFANIVLTMMELAALNSPLTGIQSPPEGIDRIDVRIYVEGTNTMNATKTFWILRTVVKSVSHHYPGRLNTLVLYDLPIVLNWIVLGVKKLVHPETASKFAVHKT